MNEKIDKQALIIACVCVLIICLGSLILRNEIAKALVIGLLFSSLILILVGIWYIIAMLIKETMIETIIKEIIKEIKNREND